MIFPFLLLFSFSKSLLLEDRARSLRLDDSNVAERERVGGLVAYSTSEYIVSHDVSARHKYETALLSRRYLLARNISARIGRKFLCCVRSLKCSQAAFQTGFNRRSFARENASFTVGKTTIVNLR